MSRQYSIVGDDDQQFVTVFIPGRAPLVAGNTHPNFDRIKDELVGEGQFSPLYDEALADLFDVSVAVAKKFVGLSERVSVAQGRVFFDGDEIHSSCADQIVRFLDEEVTDWAPLVRFLENVALNPTQHSQVQLYDWLKAREFTITPEGHIVGYKGVEKGTEGELRSVRGGRATVNGEVVNGRIPNAIGSVIEMPRSEVAHDPSESCSTGLHVGTFDYAKNWGDGTLLKVHVNPRDVVSVPTDASGQKVRVSRYTVVAIVDAPETAAIEADADLDWEDAGSVYDEIRESCECAYCTTDEAFYDGD